MPIPSMFDVQFFFLADFTQAIFSSLTQAHDSEDEVQIQFGLSGISVLKKPAMRNFGKQWSLPCD